MKKLLATLMIGACVCAAAAPAASISARAAEKPSVFLEEKFDDLKTTKWSVDTASDSMKLYSSEDSHISFDTHAEQFVLGTTEKLENLEYYQFDFMVAGSGWTPIYFSDTNLLEVAPPNYDVFKETDSFYTYRPQLAMQPNSLGAWSNNATVDEKNWSLQQNQWYTFKLKVVDSKNAEIYYALQGQDVEAQGVRATVTLNDNAKYSFDSLYIFLARGTDAGMKLSVDNLNIKYQRAVVSEGETIEYEDATITENFNGESFDERILKIATDTKSFSVVKAASMLSVNEAQNGDSIIYNQTVAVEQSVITELECLDATMSISFKEAKSDSLSFAFGMKDAADYTKGCVTVDMYADGLKLAQISEDGEKTDLTDKIATAALAKENPIVKITTNKNGTVCVYVNEEKLIEQKVEGEHYYAGYLGFVMTEETANTGKVLIDEIAIRLVSYKVPVTKSVTHNFSNDYWGNEGFEDFVMNSVGGSQYVKDGKLVWDGLSDDSYFGSAHEYDDFVLEYKISNVLVSDKKNDINATAKDKWLGIDIAKSVKGLASYGSNVVLMFNINPTASSNTLGFYMATDSPVDRATFPYKVTNHKNIPAELWEAIAYDNDQKVKTDISEGDAVCVRWVAENGTIKLYLKKACELQYTLYATVEDIDTTGYVALCCTGYTFLELDDFSMSNISSTYICADNYVPETRVEIKETIIYDRGNVDVNGATEAALNKEESKGCMSQMNMSYCILPIVLLGTALIRKQRKSGEEQ